MPTPRTPRFPPVPRFSFPPDENWTVTVVAGDRAQTTYTFPRATAWYVEDGILHVEAAGPTGGSFAAWLNITIGAHTS